jgi:hypothetical protein
LSHFFFVYSFSCLLFNSVFLVSYCQHCLINYAP